LPTFRGVRKRDAEHTVTNSGSKIGIFDRKKDFYPSIQVALHHVCAAEEELFRPAVRKIEQPRVLEKAADDGRHDDVVAQTGHPGSKTALTPHLELDLYPSR
jgi:hypothetical protein